MLPIRSFLDVVFEESDVVLLMVRSKSGFHSPVEGQVVFPICRVSYIPGGAGFLPSTVACDESHKMSSLYDLFYSDDHVVRTDFSIAEYEYHPAPTTTKGVPTQFSTLLG